MQATCGGGKKSRRVTVTVATQRFGQASGEQLKVDGHTEGVEGLVKGLRSWVNTRLR